MKVGRALPGAINPAAEGTHHKRFIIGSGFIALALIIALSFLIGSHFGLSMKEVKAQSSSEAIRVENVGNETGQDVRMKALKSEYCRKTPGKQAPSDEDTSEKEGEE